MDESLWGLISRTMSSASGLEQGVFYLLMAFSLVSWSVIFWKICSFYEARRNTLRFMSLFDNAGKLGEIQAASSAVGPSPAAEVFRSALTVLEQQPTGGVAVADARSIAVRPQTNQEELFTLSMRHTAQTEFQRMHFGLGFLATIGSTAPFIGLFGTVWGIMDTFRDLGDAKTASLAVVAPGISAALIATAAGLAVAIPAVMAYNAFLAQLDTMQENCDSFIERLGATVRASGWLHASKSVLNAAPTPAPAAPAQVKS